MAKSAHSWALPVAIIGIWALLREVKSIKLPTFPEWPDWDDFQIKGTQDLLDERTEDLQHYEAERVSDAQRIESERATELLATGGDYGTVSAAGQTWTGQWFNTPNKAGDSCHIIFASPYSSNANRFFTGAICRQARAQGLIE